MCGCRKELHRPTGGRARPASGWSCAPAADHRHRARNPGRRPVCRPVRLQGCDRDAEASTSARTSPWLQENTLPVRPPRRSAVGRDRDRIDRRRQMSNDRSAAPAARCAKRVVAGAPTRGRVREGDAVEVWLLLPDSGVRPKPAPESSTPNGVSHDAEATAFRPAHARLRSARCGRRALVSAGWPGGRSRYAYPAAVAMRQL